MATKMGNLSKFNEISATIFLQLYESFPSKINLKAEDFPEYNTVEYADIFFNTLSFYIDEKFIQCEGRFYGGFTGLRLTSKGFSVLNTDAPVKLSPDSNLVTAIKDAVKTGKAELIKGLISAVIRSLI